VHAESAEKIVLHGGLAGSRKNDTYILSNSFDKWVWRSPACSGGKPPPSCYHHCWSASFQVPNADRVPELRTFLFVYAGQGDDRESLSATYCLDLESFRWRRLFIAEPPPPRELAAVGFCRGTAWIYGGRARPEDLKRSDLWRLDFSQADFSLNAAGQQESVSGCRWHQLTKQSGSDWPEARYGAPFAVLDDCLYMYGGLCGTQRQACSTETWRFHCALGIWEKLETRGYAPTGRMCHSLWAVADKDIVLWGGQEDGGSLPTGDIYALDLQFMHWSKPHVGGSVPPLKKDFGWAPFADGRAVIFGGNPLKRLVDQARDDDDLRAKGRPLPSATAVSILHLDSISVKSKSVQPKLAQSSGVTLNMGPELALQDAESLLMQAKKEVLQLEAKLHDVYNEKAGLLQQVRQLKEEQQLDQTTIQDLQEDCGQLRLALDKERQLRSMLHDMFDLERALRGHSTSALTALKHALATGESINIMVAEALANTAIEAELDCRPELVERRRLHAQKLREVGPMVETFQSSLTENEGRQLAALEEEYTALSDQAELEFEQRCAKLGMADPQLSEDKPY